MNADYGLLDRLIPLAGASHADVVDYAIFFPLRYAECAADLSEGARVRLRYPHQLLGWSGPAGRRTFYFRCGHRGLAVRTNSERNTVVREIRGLPQLAVLGVDGEPSGSRVADNDGLHRIVGRDGALLYVSLGQESPDHAYANWRPSIGRPPLTGGALAAVPAT